MISLEKDLAEFFNYVIVIKEFISVREKLISQFFVFYIIGFQSIMISYLLDLKIKVKKKGLAVHLLLYPLSSLFLGLPKTGLGLCG